LDGDGFWGEINDRGWVETPMYATVATTTATTTTEKNRKRKTENGKYGN